MQRSYLNSIGNLSTTYTKNYHSLLDQTFCLKILAVGSERGIIRTFSWQGLRYGIDNVHSSSKAWRVHGVRTNGQKRGYGVLFCHVHTWLFVLVYCSKVKLAIQTFIFIPNPFQICLPYILPHSFQKRQLSKSDLTDLTDQISLKVRYVADHRDWHSYKEEESVA